MFGINKLKKEIEFLMGQIVEIKRQFKDLQVTSNSLMDDITKVSSKIEDSIHIAKIKLDVDMTDELWWEKVECPKNADFNTRQYYYELEKMGKKTYAKTHPSLKKHIIFHGGCLGCGIPQKEGLGRCLGCGYYDWMSGKPYLSK